jgi:hypothetical protein
MLKLEGCGTGHSTPLSFEDFELFARGVWQTEGRAEPLIVSAADELPSMAQDELSDMAATGRWESLPEFSPKTHGSPVLRPTAFIDVKVEGLCRLFALHEIAHLLCDTEDVWQDHAAYWMSTYRDLIDRYLGICYGAAWHQLLEWWSEKWRQYVADDPEWLVDVLRDPH